MGISQEALAKAAGIPLESYKKYEMDKRSPRAEVLLAIAKANGASLAWLAGGPGEPAAPGETAGTRLLAHSDRLREQLRVEEPRAGYVYVPLYDVHAAAGRPGAAPQTEAVVNELAFREDWIRSTLHVAPGDLSLVHVEGDSMEPDLRAGDIILIDHTDTTARREGVYVIRMEDALLVKQVQRLGGGVLKLISRNPAYEPINVPLPDIQTGEKYAIIGRVVWACRRL